MTEEESENVFEENLKLLKFREVVPPDETIGSDGYPESYQYNRKHGDMEKGVEIRAQAAERLGGLKDARAIPHLGRALYDGGDADGHSDFRVRFYYRGAERIQKAAVDALVEIGGKEAMNALEGKLKDIQNYQPSSTYPPIETGVSGEYIAEALKKLRESN